MYLFCHEEYYGFSPNAYGQLDPLNNPLGYKDLFKQVSYCKLLIDINMTKEELLKHYDNLIRGIAIILKKDDCRIIKDEGTSRILSTVEVNEYEYFQLIAQQFEIWDEVTNDTDALLLYELR